MFATNKKLRNATTHQTDGALPKRQSQRRLRFLTNAKRCVCKGLKLSKTQKMLQKKYPWGYFFCFAEYFNKHRQRLKDRHCNAMFVCSESSKWVAGSRRKSLFCSKTLATRKGTFYLLKEKLADENCTKYGNRTLHVAPLYLRKKLCKNRTE